MNDFPEHSRHCSTYTNIYQALRTYKAQGTVGAAKMSRTFSIPKSGLSVRGTEKHFRYKSGQTMVNIKEVQIKCFRLIPKEERAILF